MQFRTQIPLLKSNSPIDYTSKMVSLGSCFVENIGEKFDYFKFKNTVNPFGIIFNAISLEKIVRRSVEKEYFAENDIFFHNDLWHCYEVHSELSSPEKTFFLNSLNQLIDSTCQQLKDSTHIIITLGTSWVYRNKETNEIVANCHKVPQKQFKKELLSVETMKQSLENTMALIAGINKEAKIIFTVSPVRHLKDGFVENQWSKANLITAIHQTITNQQSLIGNLQSIYFPSYEIMMDELRDYRFYAEDMLHPNQVAVNYIWQRFKETSISETAFKIMDEIEIIQKGIAHRPFNPDSESHLKFLKKLEIKKTKLTQQFPQIEFDK